MNLMQGMLSDVVERGIDEETAITGLRAISRWYGGQQLYIPLKKNSASADDLLRVLQDAVGDSQAEKLLEVILRLYGGVAYYIPIEVRAFKKQIAEEVFKTYDGSTETMRDLCRKYSMSFTQMYRLWYAGRDESKQLKLDFE